MENNRCSIEKKSRIGKAIPAFLFPVALRSLFIIKLDGLVVPKGI